MQLSIMQSTNFLIVQKDIRPTVPLKNQADKETLLDLVAQQYPEVLTVHGKNSWEGSALHRLDTITTGAVLFARNQAFYDFVSKQQESDSFIKTYIARCNENAELPPVFSSYFRAFGPGRKRVKVELNSEKADTDRLYTTKFKVLKPGIVQCTITRGFRHQIRAHLSYLGWPIVGDPLYSTSDGDFSLVCVGMKFTDLDGKKVDYNSLNLPDNYKVLK